MHGTDLAPTTRARSRCGPKSAKSTTDPLGTTTQVEASLPDDPLRPDGFTSRQLLDLPRERLRRLVIDQPEQAGDWWTALGTTENVLNLRNKLARGRFSAGFLLEVVTALGAKTIELDEAQRDLANSN